MLPAAEVVVARRVRHSGCATVAGAAAAVLAGRATVMLMPLGVLTAVTKVLQVMSLCFVGGRHARPFTLLLWWRSLAF